MVLTYSKRWHLEHGLCSLGDPVVWGLAYQVSRTIIFVPKTQSLLPKDYLWSPCTDQFGSLELQHLPANPWAFNWRPCPGSEEFERGPLWQEIWTRTVTSFHWNNVLSFNKEVFKDSKFTFVSRWLRNWGPQSHDRQSCLSTKKLTINPTFGWSIWAQF